MEIKQHTIEKEVTVKGVGLHTGKTVNMTFKPAGINHGLKFQRIDLEGQPIVEADVDYVTDLSRGTTLEKNGVVVTTVEHTLAAFVGLQIDNALICLDSPEPPILDGSSIGFVELLEEAGRKEQEAIRNYFEVPEGIFYRDEKKDVEIAALPLNDSRVTVMVDYNSPVLGSQHASLNSIHDFKTDIANCRTFCFLHELEALHQANLIQGGDLTNAIVIVDREVNEAELDRLSDIFKQKKVEVRGEGILNNTSLRFKDEPARHKLLDVLGDLALIGRPIKAQILAARPGHASNVAFARKIKRIIKEKERKLQESGITVPDYDPKKPITHNAQDIYNILPHRIPFALVDLIYHLDEKSVGAVKNVTLNEPYFQGHFPGNPVMPGVMIVEAMAQAGGVLALSMVDDNSEYWTYFLGVDKCRWRKLVVPGDTLIFKLNLNGPMRRGIIRMTGKAYVKGEVVCEAEMTASLVKKQ